MTPDSDTRLNDHDSRVTSDSSIGSPEGDPPAASSSIFDDLPSRVPSASDGTLGLEPSAPPDPAAFAETVIRGEARPLPAGNMAAAPASPPMPPEEVLADETPVAPAEDPRFRIQDSTLVIEAEDDDDGPPAAMLAGSPGQTVDAGPPVITEQPTPLEVPAAPPVSREDDPHATIVFQGMVMPGFDPESPDSLPLPPSASAAVEQQAVEVVRRLTGESTIDFSPASGRPPESAATTEAAPPPEEPPVAPADAGSTGSEAEAAALAALGGAAVGAAMGHGDPWTTSSAGDEATTSSYRPPPRPAPKRDTLKIALISYAVLSTIVVGILVKRLMDKTVREEKLESLPDFRTLKVGQVSSVQPVETQLAPGHTLHLGEKRRFGNIEVEALKVTRGMVEYTHPDDPSLANSPEGPVVKLWLRFRNVSQDQAIPVLDRYLVFSKQPAGRTQGYYTNNFLSLAADRKPFGYMLTHDHKDKNELKGQLLGEEIAPGEELETFIPTTPVIELPEGDLLWRVHMRKGFGRAGVGVTTLFEVAFTAKDVIDDDKLSARM